MSAKMVDFLLAALLCVIPVTQANVATTKPACPASGKAASSLQACSTATAFCERFLRKSLSTVYVTSTITTTAYSSTFTSYDPTHYAIPIYTTTCLSPAGVGPTGSLTTAVGSAAYDYATYSGVKKRTAATAIPSCGLSRVTSGISSACNCVLQTTNTITTTTTFETVTTTTSTSYFTETVVSYECATPDTSCNNAGFSVAYYRVPEDQLGTSWDPESANSGVSNFDPTHYKTLPPRVVFQETELSGWTSEGFSTNTNSPQAYPFFQFYQQGEPFTSFVINHVMYFYPPTNGTYTFNVGGADNYVAIWLQQDAWAGWDSSNAFFITNQVGPSTIGVNLLAAQYYPLRIIMGGGGTPNILSLSITAPDGTLMLASAQQNSTTYFVTQSCDGTAPAFPPFGNEPTT